MNFLNTLREQVLIIDGAMGTMIQGLGLTDADFGGSEFRMLSDLLVFSRSREVQEIHFDYFHAGANAVETNSFGASPMRLSEYDFSRLDVSTFAVNPYGVDPRELSYEQFAYYLSRRAAEIACEAREQYRQDAAYDGRPLFVLGSLGPSNRVISSTKADLKTATFDEIADNFHHQVLGLIDGGADALIYETQQDILETKAAVFGGRRAMAEKGMSLPIICQVTVDQFSKMQIFNTDIQAALVTMQGAGIDVFGINCSIGPDLMVKTVEILSRFSKLPISVVPNAGLPVSEDGRTVFKFSPEDFADLLEQFVEKYGVSVVGGCCGTTPAHIRAVAQRVGGRKPTPRVPEDGLYVSGPQKAVLLDSSQDLIRIGERLNVRGSKKVRDAVEGGGGTVNHDALEEVVAEQVRDLGVNVIDVCMDSNVVDTAEALKEVVHKQTTDFSGAMSLDSFAVDALVEAVKVYPGRPIINSISMEEVAPGETKLDAVVSVTKHHDPIYVGLCTGPKGPGSTREEKYELAKEIYETGRDKYGLRADQFFIDVNVFPVGAESIEGMNFAVESLEAIAMVKSIHPDIRTVVGVGNLTNGLAKKPYMRTVLTSVWLDEARKRGLDAAIINPNHYVFVKDLDPKDYELGRRTILEHDMNAFAELEDIAEEKKGNVVVKRTTYADLPLETAICEKVKDGYKERENGTFELGGHTYAYVDRIALQAAEIVKTHEPLAFINRYLMGAMQELGDGFARGEVSLPHLLKSADVMKQVMGFLEEYMRVSSGRDIHAEIQYKGTIVIGTVFQDVHSIGKDLAKTLFENYGYRVIDLGVMTPLQSFIDNAKEYKADAIGMSALLVQTSNHMITVSKMMLEQGLEKTAVLIGGAPVNYRHAAYVAKAGSEDEESMRPDVFYCATAMDGVNVMNSLLSVEDRSPYYDENLKKLQSQFARAERMAKEDAELLAKLPRREIHFNGHSPVSLSHFRAKKLEYSLKEFSQYFDLKTLFALNWKFGGKATRAGQGVTEAELLALKDEWVEKSEKNGWLRPQGVFGLFPCQSDGDEIVIYDPEDLSKELCRMDFAVVIGAGRKDTICAAQYFLPKSGGVMDTVGLQIATGGPDVEAALQSLKDSGDSEASLYLQGLSDRCAEDMADRIHAALRETVGHKDERLGIRWSPGYPAMPNTENNAKILRLLGASDEIGVHVTDA
ncbi:MAG: homocysteine S-methyltransferase family protein, partial [FCB group bacterium]|nr:homocysteine S-methyltransferase family protein [FCB group bacterium]